MRLAHDTQRCEAHGVCVAVDPARFELDDDDQLVVHEWTVSDADQATVRQAVQSCPVQALTLIED